ncbi:hypothetical protein KI688_009187 [Linnemannia hyalina]|uniref:Uncharacterized protein n=1 Tax=Linnemannia hyalina TaxID=64524 RepID=A0A9P7Y0D4_9FUNG|nr:hypothetical protein KI688_009187 [Linnemannia hyalina]
MSTARPKVQTYKVNLRSIQEPNNALSAKDVKGHDASGFRQHGKRNSKKRRKNTQVSYSMEGIESTSPATITTPVHPATPATPPIPGMDTLDHPKASLKKKLKQATREKSKEKQDISIKLQRDRGQALRRINWQRGAPMLDPEKIHKLEEEWHDTLRRLDKLQEASMNA